MALTVERTSNHCAVNGSVQRVGDDATPREYDGSGHLPAAGSRIAKLWLVALVAAAISFGIKRVLPFHAPLLLGPCVLLCYGAIYLGMTQWMGIASLGAVGRLFARRR